MEDEKPNEVWKPDHEKRLVRCELGADFSQVQTLKARVVYKFFGQAQVWAPIFLPCSENTTHTI